MTNRAATRAAGESRPRRLDNLVAAEVWESRWQQADVPQPLDLRASGVRATAEFVRRVLPRGDRVLIEVGCGASAWLPFFALELGYRVSGIDFSPAGVDLARRSLEAYGLEGTIIQGDLFDRDLLEPGSFDAVFSNGFVEHFPDTRKVLARMGDLLKPGGLMITVVPNLQGALGVAQKLLDRPVFEQHVVMDGPYLEQCHKEAGLTTVRGPEYLGGFNLWALNWDGLLEGRGRAFRWMFAKSIAALNLAADAGLGLCGVRDGRRVSQMIAIAARKEPVSS